MNAAIAGGSSTIGVAHVVLQSTVPLHLSQVPARSAECPWRGEHCTEAVLNRRSAA
jgi:hypothetical protein